MNEDYDTWLQIGIFLAAYTAVNHVSRGLNFRRNFLAAYTAVNSSVAIVGLALTFLAAYTAVNSLIPLGWKLLRFLSCLHGSELAPKTYNHLKEKEIPSFSRQKPSFFEVS